MPRLSVYFVRASLVYMLPAFTFGGLLLANKGVMISPVIWALLPVHIEFAFMGWMAQFALGIGFWILPRYGSGAPRGDERWSWLCFALVNAGIILIVANSIAGVQALGFGARGLELLGFAAFAIGNWGRVKPLMT